MEEMRSFASETTRAIQNDVAAMFSPTGVGALVAVTVLIQNFHRIVEEAHEIHATSERFRIDAQELQTISNVAKELGIPIESVARAMNRVEIAAYQATQANNESRKALEGLRIDVGAFFKLSADEKFLALARAYQEAGDKATAYAEIAQIVGKRQAEVIRLIQQGPEAIQAQGNAMLKFSDTTIAQLEAIRVQGVQLWNFISHGAANAFGAVVASFNTGIVAILKGLEAAGDTFSGFFAFIERGLHFDFEGAKKAWADWQVKAIAAIDAVGEEEKKQFGKNQPPTPPGQRQGIEGEQNSPSAADTKKGLEDQVKLEEQLAKLERDRAFNLLSDQGKLEALQRELNALHLKRLDFSVSHEEHLRAMVAETQKQIEVDKLKGKIEEDNANYAEQENKIREDMAKKAEQELADSEELTKELHLQAIGRKDLADRAKIEYDYVKAIKEAQDAVTKAEEHGLTAVANTNRALITQLTIERQAALAAHDKAVREEQAKKAAEERAAVDDEKTNLAVLQQELVILDLKLAGQDEAARLVQIELDFNIKINQALAEAADLWTKMAQAYRDGNVALGDQLAQHAQLKQDEATELELEKQKTEQLESQNQALKDQATSQSAASPNASTYGSSPLTVSALAEGNLRIGATSEIYAAALAASRGLKAGSEAYNRLVQQIEAQDRLRELQGHNLSFYDQLARDQLVNWWAGGQQQQASQSATTSHQQEIEYWEAIAAGRPAPAGNPYSLLYAPQVPASQNPNVALGTLTNQGYTQIQLLQQIVQNTTLVRI